MQAGDGRRSELVAGADDRRKMGGDVKQRIGGYGTSRVVRVVFTPFKSPSGVNHSHAATQYQRWSRSLSEDIGHNGTRRVDLPLLEEGLSIDHILSNCTSFPSPITSRGIDLIQTLSPMRIPPSNQQ